LKPELVSQRGSPIPHEPTLRQRDYSRLKRGGKGLVRRYTAKIRWIFLGA